MTDIKLHVGGFTLIAESAVDEPRFRDDEIAAGLEYGRLRNFRKMLRRLRDEGELPGVYCRAELERQSTGNGASRQYEVDVFWLTEREVTIATMHARTEKARAFRAMFADIVVRARHELRGCPRLETVNIAHIHGARLGDSDEGRKNIAAMVRLAAASTGAGTQAVHGAIRRVFQVPSPYAVSYAVWSHVRALLVEIAEGRYQLKAKAPRQLPAASPGQLSLPGLPALTLVRR